MVQILAYNKNKLFKILDRSMLDFDILEKSLGIVSPPHFGYNFSRKMFFMWWWWWCWWWIVFVVWLTNERLGSSPSQISNRLQGFELVQNLSSGFVEWSCAVYYVLWMKFCSTLCSILCSINWPNFIAWFQFMGYWSKCVLQLFVNQIVKSSIWKLTLCF